MNRRKQWMVVPLLGLSVALGAAACASKEQKETARPEPGEPDEPSESSDGPQKKIMPLELKADVDNVFMIRRSELERCYNDYVVNTGNKKLKGTIIIAVRIGWRKHPSKVWFMKNEFSAHPKLTECFLEKLRKWEFPTWGGLMDYAFPRLTLEEM